VSNDTNESSHEDHSGIENNQVGIEGGTNEWIKTK
jgi:hypothetical protein